MSVDQFFNRVYDRHKYNCAHFVVDVVKELKGEDIGEAMQSFLVPPDKRTARPSVRHAFARLANPENYCIVLMQRAKTSPHVGVFIGGKVLQIHERGVEHLGLDLAARGFSRVTFYKCSNK